MDRALAGVVGGIVLNGRLSETERIRHGDRTVAVFASSIPSQRSLVGRVDSHSRVRTFTILLCRVPEESGLGVCQLSGCVRTLTEC